MRPWLVTGANGHLGHLVVRAFAGAGRPVRAAVHRRRDAIAGLDAELITLDVRDRDAVLRACEGVEGVVHLAARISLDARDGDEMLATHRDGAANIVAACRAHGARLVHGSSIHAFDPAPLGEAVDESRGLASDARHFVYDRSKALGEAEVRAATDVESVILNPTAMLGPDDHGPSEIGLFFRRLLTGTLPGLVDADFDWVDARDVAAQILALTAQPRRGRYVLAGARASLPQLARLACELGDVRPPRMTSPLWLAQATAPFAVGWARLRGTAPLYTSASLHTLACYRSVDGTKARAELGWSPRPLDETVRDTVRWWKAKLA